jgi:16S rRNA (adenine1518-N6/adenine1519-N6)-dimethyltransferase
MTNTSSVRERLRAAGLSPRKSLGQNFLTDDGMARRIVAAAGVEQADTAIEIGPGIGALTRHLSAVAARVIAIEIDRNLIPLLQQELSTATNATIVQADAMEVDFSALLQNSGLPADAPVRFIGNLPYYITSAMIRRMLESRLRIRSIVLTVQLEVAQRMVAQPDDMSLLAVSVQFYGKPELLMRVSPSAFYPQPEVDSAVVRITPYAAGLAGDADTLFALARAGFSQRRKQLRNTLASGLRLSKTDSEEVLYQAGIDSTRRAETLAVEDWVRLSEVYVRLGYPGVNLSLNRSSASASNSDDPAPSAANATEP